MTQTTTDWRASSEVVANVSDFGGMVQGEGVGLASPNTLDELVDLVRVARRDRTKLTLRGRGWSQSGQSVPDRSRVVSLARLSRISEPDGTARSVHCGAGATFREVAERCFQSGFTPRVLPLNLDLTVGGVLSAGGFGSNSHHWGPIVSQVQSAQVVLGTGEVVSTGPNENRSVYDAVFGGVGRCGVITGAALAIDPLPRCVRTFYLLYEDLATLIHDARLVRSRAHHMEAFCSSSIQGACRAEDGGRKALVHWLYGLHVSIHAEAPEAVDVDEVLRGLTFRRLLHDDHDTPAAFAARYDIRFNAMRQSGAWSLPHPWFEALLPVDSLEPFVQRALAVLSPVFGDGHRILFHPRVDRPKALAFPLQEAAGFAVLPQGIAKPFLSSCLHSLRELDRLLADVGGKRYLSGYLFDMNQTAWKRHYAGDYEDLRRAKHEFDPDDVFVSRLAAL